MRAVPDVKHNVAARRFETTVDGQRAELVYHREAERVFLDHTGVPPPIEGRGIGSALVRAAVTEAIAREYTIVPLCWFVRGWLERHPEVAERANIDWSGV